MGRGVSVILDFIFMWWVVLVLKNFRELGGFFMILLEEFRMKLVIFNFS